MPLPEIEKEGLRYARRVLKATDIWFNVLAGGELGQSISARSALARDAGSPFGCILCRAALDLFEKKHCDIALSEETTK